MANPLWLNRGGVLRRGFIQPQDLDKSQASTFATTLKGSTVIWDSTDSGVSFPTASITTPTLSQSFAHLMVLWFGKSASASVDYLGLQFNGVTSSTYYYEIFESAGTSTSGAGNPLTSLALIGRMTQNNGFDSCGCFFIPNYSGGSYKPLVGISFAETAAAPTFGVDLIGSLSNNSGIGSSPITTIKFLTNSGASINNGRFTIYGLAG